MNQNIPYGKIRNPSQLGRLVRMKRKALGVDQQRAAGLTGVGVRFLSELERGKATLELGKVMQVITRLGLELRLLDPGVDEEAP